MIQNPTLRFLPGVGHWLEQEAPEEVNSMLTARLTYPPISGSATVSPRGRIRA